MYHKMLAFHLHGTAATTGSNLWAIWICFSSCGCVCRAAVGRRRGRRSSCVGRDHRAGCRTWVCRGCVWSAGASAEAWGSPSTRAQRTGDVGEEGGRTTRRQKACPFCEELASAVLTGGRSPALSPSRPCVVSRCVLDAWLRGARTRPGVRIR